VSEENVNGRRDDPVLYEVKDKIATITLNRPHRLNAMNVAMVDRLPEVFRQFDRDDGRLHRRPPRQRQGVLRRRRP